jgi:thiol:disulfide interchange protein DsbC
LAWDQWMLKGIVPPPAPANCSFENEQLLALGHKLKVKGTPAVIFTDGSRIPGAAGAAAIEEKLTSLSK